MALVARMMNIKHVDIWVGLLNMAGKAGKLFVARVDDKIKIIPKVCNALQVFD
jgi:hypothetical protein